MNSQDGGSNTVVDHPLRPSTTAPHTGGWRRALALFGVTAGFLLYLVPGFIALNSYRKWRDGRSAKPAFAWGVAAVMIALLAFVSVAAAMRNARRDQFARDVFGASTRLSSHDADVISSLGAHMTSWNLAASKFIEGYIDPTVSAKRWVREARPHVREMRRVLLLMTADIESIEDQGMRATLRRFGDILTDEVGGIIELHNAIANLDPVAEQAAVEHLQQASEERQRIAREMLDRLRQYVDADQLQQLFRSAVEAFEGASTP